MSNFCVDKNPPLAHLSCNEMTCAHGTTGSDQNLIKHHPHEVVYYDDGMKWGESCDNGEYLIHIYNLNFLNGLSNLRLGARCQYFALQV